MIDYVVIIANCADNERYVELCRRFESATTTWTRSYSQSGIAVFTRARANSRFDINVTESGFLLGIDVSESGKKWGAYVEINQDAGSNHVTVARDPTGLMPCWHASVDGTEILFSCLRDVADIVPQDIDWEFLRYHLITPYTRGKRTGLSGITEVLPGWELNITPGLVDQRAWWSPVDLARENLATPSIARHVLREAGIQAVGSWGRRYDRIALTLSGGLDSAIVLGLLRRYAPQTEIIGVNFLVSHAEGDERAYAQSAAQLHGIPLRIETVSPDGLTFDLDEGRNRPRPSTFVLPLGYRQAREHIVSQFQPDAIFTGTGGDHLFHQSASPLAVADAILDDRPYSEILAVAHQLASLGKETIWAVLVKAIKARISRVPSGPDLGRMRNAYLDDDTDAGFDLNLAHPDLVSGLGQTRPGKLRQIIGIHQLQDHFWRYGPDFAADEVHPLVSKPLLEAALATPIYWASFGGIRRGLARTAFADFLPNDIRTRRGKGSNTSQWIAVMSRNLPFLRELLLDGELAHRKIISRQKLEQILTPMRLAGRPDLASLVACLNTEIWIQQVKSGRHRPLSQSAAAA